MIYFTADLHFFHKNIIRYDLRPYHNVDEMNADIIAKWNNKVKEDDTVYILGDLGLDTKRIIPIVKQLKGHKVLIRGNHDNVKNKEFANCFEEITDYKELNITGKKVVLCHYPIAAFNNHFYGTYHFYAHVHNSHEWHYVESYKWDAEALDIPLNMINVGCMMPWMNYEPKTFDEIVDGYNEWRKSNG